ncbi:MAG: alanine racemase [Kiritimatiellaceae bacterium]|jgi:alanine racemase|nr:alanine racemase [Kiritimatiellaceae bacterium]|tara:strand:- start:6417 stop:7523 length:1107 start_codon:yes stop_codon:yes gene_type:complete
MKNYLTASISASAVQHNLQELRKKINPGVQLCPVVKDNCYGHGLNLLYPTLAKHADGFIVASPSEALEIRSYGYTGFILCLLSAYFDETDIQEELIRQGVTQTVMSKAALETVAAAAKRCQKTAPIHLKIDSGMGRLGVAAAQATNLFSLIEKTSHIQLTGAYTHFASSDDPDTTYMHQQLNTFLDVLPKNNPLTRHAANTSALIHHPDTHLDLVRPGLSVYGCHYAEHLRSKINLRPCMSVYAQIIAIKKMPSGSFSGYGRTHQYPRDSRVAVVPIGYGDGYFRSLSNQAVVHIHGKPAAVCGRVSMDQMTVDITDHPQINIGDPVEIISAHATAPNSVENLAKLAHTIPYEITCHMGRNLHHKLVD